MAGAKKIITAIKKANLNPKPKPTSKTAEAIKKKKAALLLAKKKADAAYAKYVEQHRAGGKELRDKRKKETQAQKDKRQELEYEASRQERTSPMQKGGVAKKKKGMARGGMKKKTMARGGAMMKKKGMAKGGMKKKGYSRGGAAKRVMKK